MRPYFFVGTGLCPSGFFLLSWLILLLLPGLSPACAAQNLLPALPQKSELRILTTVFPVYLFTRNVTASRSYVRVELLVPPRTGCPHGYAPTPQDLQKLTRAHVVIFNGLGLEGFLKGYIEKLPSTVALVDCSRGITPLSLSDHKHCKHGHSHFNPHIFAGPRQAVEMVYNIAEALARLDPQGASAYTKAAEAYAARLLSLERRLYLLGQRTPNKGIILQHDALAYLAQNAGLNIVAVLQENEDMPPSAARLMELIRQIQSSKPVLIAVEPQFSDRLAQAVARETGLPIISLDPLASGPPDAPLSYYEAVMATNCNLLEQYFGKL